MFLRNGEAGIGSKVYVGRAGRLRSGGGQKGWGGRGAEAGIDGRRVGGRGGEAGIGGGEAHGGGRRAG